jgi:hypothetical protein
LERLGGCKAHQGDLEQFDPFAGGKEITFTRRHCEVRW